MTSDQSKSVIITGGASGIGAHLMETLAAKGHTVVIGDINDGSALINRVKAETSNEKLYYVPLDVTDFGSQQRFFREAASLINGPINTVVANAGVNITPESAEYLRPEDYTTGPLDRPAPKYKTVDTLLTGTMWTTHLAISYFKKPSPTAATDDHHILLVSSLAGFLGVPVVPLYAISKHGVIGLFKSLRYTSEIAGYRINVLCPYFINTPILSSVGKVLLAGSPMATLEDVSDIGLKVITEKEIDGKIFTIIPPSSVEDAKSLGIPIPEGSDPNEKRAVWEFVIQTGDSPDNFARRIMMLVRLQAAAKGWSDTVKDLAGLASTSIGGWFYGKK